jgi:predicted secreted protein
MAAAVALSALLAAGGLTACGGDDESGGETTTTTATDTTTPKMLTFSDPALPIAVVRGQEFAIELESNASTGYVWTITTPPDPALVETLTPEGNTQAHSASGGVGAPGSTIFEFKGEASGSTPVTFTYARPSAPDENPSSTTFTINVS